MTKEEQNIKVHGIVDGGCWHEEGFYHDSKDEWVDEWYLGLNSAYEPTCKKCYDPQPYNPNYLTPDGIAKIREWLEKEDKWEKFELFIYKSLEAKYKEWKGRDLEICFKAIDIATDPNKFIPAFINYMEKPDEHNI